MKASVGSSCSHVPTWKHFASETHVLCAWGTAFSQPSVHCRHYSMVEAKQLHHVCILHLRSAVAQESDALRPLCKEWLSQIPAGRLAEVTDLQAAIVLLASDAAAYMTGHNLVLDGGHTLW